MFRSCYGVGAQVNIVFLAGSYLRYIAPYRLRTLDFVQKLRSERLAAILLIVAAALGLVVANLPFGSAVIAASHVRLGVAPFALSAADWVTDGLLAIFFFLAAVELKHELRHGELASRRHAIVPAAAAIGGVIVPAALYLVILRDPALASGWPIPTATDIAFALGVLALVGRGIPPRVRALLLALAVLDDLIAIVIIAVFFTSSLALVPLLCAIPAIVVFLILSRLRVTAVVVVALILVGVVTWGLVALSGIHPTIAGVALGLVMAGRPAARARHTLEPISNVIILPLFAFVAALVAIPNVGLDKLSPAFWAILIALPLGKLIGISLGAAIAVRVLGRDANSSPLGDILVVASLGGIGFTVSLLMNQLAWRGVTELTDEGTLAIISASLIAVIIGGVVTVRRARHYRRAGHFR